MADPFKIQPFEHSEEINYSGLNWDVYNDADLYRIMRVSKPNIAEISINQYIKNLRLFKKLYDEHQRKKKGDVFIEDYYGGGIHDFNFLIPTEEYNPKDLVKDLPISTQRNYWNAILPVIKSFSSPFIYSEKWSGETSQVETEKYYGEAIRLINKLEKENAKKGIISEKKKEKYAVSFEDVLKLIPILKKQKNFQDALILSLMTEYKFRNEIATLKLIRRKHYQKLTVEQKTENNYVVVKGNGDMFISRGAFKTDGTYGIIISDVDNEILKEDLTKYIEGMTDDIFFKNSLKPPKQKQLSQGDISTRIGRITEKHLKVKLGTSSITKLFMSSLDKDTLLALQKLSETRGTSVNVLLASYFNNI
jgi:hypothetical protein